MPRVHFSAKSFAFVAPWERTVFIYTVHYGVDGCYCGQYPGDILTGSSRFMGHGCVGCPDGRSSPDYAEPGTTSNIV